MSKDKLTSALDERGREYGDFRNQGIFAQQMKNIVRDAPAWGKMDMHQREAIDMILHKISRIVNGNPNHVDSWMDIEGYARIVRDRISLPDSEGGEA